MYFVMDKFKNRASHPVLDNFIYHRSYTLVIEAKIVYFYSSILTCGIFRSILLLKLGRRLRYYSTVPF